MHQLRCHTSPHMPCGWWGINFRSELALGTASTAAAAIISGGCKKRCAVLKYGLLMIWYRCMGHAPPHAVNQSILLYGEKLRHTRGAGLTTIDLDAASKILLLGALSRIWDDPRKLSLLPNP